MTSFGMLMNSPDSEFQRISPPKRACVVIKGANCWIVGKPEVIPPIFRKILAAAVGRTGRNARPTLVQFAEPDVAVADWMIVVL
jgi:hypothetical protein